MPIPLTKLNKVLELHKDLSNNSYIYNQYILTCDIDDTQYLDNGTVRSNKTYINNLIQKKLPSFMYPSDIFIFKEDFPRTQNGKVDKKGLIKKILEFLA